MLLLSHDLQHVMYANLTLQLEACVRSLWCKKVRVNDITSIINVPE